MTDEMTRVRTAVAVGTTLVLVAVAVALGTGGWWSEDGGPAAVSTGSATTSPEPTSDPPQSSPASPTPTVAPEPRRRWVLGPRGVGALRLGMSPAEVEATGQATSTPGTRHEGWKPGCEIVEYAPRLGVSYGYGGEISPAHGLEVLIATPAMATPEGIGTRSSLADLRAAYPGRRAGPYDLVRVPTGTGAIYVFNLGPSAVDAWSLELPDHDCAR